MPSSSPSKPPKGSSTPSAKQLRHSCFRPPVLCLAVVLVILWFGTGPLEHYVLGPDNSTSALPPCPVSVLPSGTSTGQPSHVGATADADSFILSNGDNHPHVFLGSVTRAAASPAKGNGPSARKCKQALLTRSGTQVKPVLGAVYSGCVGQSNLGDDLVADLFLDLLAEAVLARTPASVKVSVNRSVPVHTFPMVWACGFRVTCGCDFAVLGGGSTVWGHYVKAIKGALGLRRPVVVFGSGYQNQPGATYENFRFFPFLQNTSVFGGVRGPKTMDVLADHNVTRLPIIYDSGIFADLVYGRETSRLSSEFLERVQRSKRPLAMVTVKGSTPPGWMKYLIQKLARQYQVVLQPVDPQGLLDHMALATDVNAALWPGSVGVVVHREFRHWATVLDLYRRAQVSVSSRLHSGVLSIATLRPTIFVADNIKTLDLMSSLQLERWSYDTKNLKRLPRVPAGDKVVRYVEQATKYTEAFGSKISEHREAALQLHRKAVAQLLDRMANVSRAKFMRVFECCNQIEISRSTPRLNRMLINIACLDARPVWNSQDIGSRKAHKRPPRNVSFAPSSTHATT